MAITIDDMAADAGIEAPNKPKKDKKPKKSTEGADRAVVDAVKEELRAVIAATIDKGTDDVGDLLLARFYGSDPKRYGGKNPDNPSLNLLLEECSEHDLHVSRTFLGNALRSAVFRHRLGNESYFCKLDPSHRVELLCLGDPDDEEVRTEVEAFAEESHLNEYSVRKLREEVEDQRGTGIRKKAVARTVDACVRNLTDRATGQLAFTGKDFKEMPARQLDHVERRALELQEHARAVVELVRAQRAQAAREASTAAVTKAAVVKVAKAKADQGGAKPAELVAKKAEAAPSQPPVKAPAAPAAVAAGAAEKRAPEPSRRRDGEKAAPESSRRRDGEKADPESSRRRDGEKAAPSVAKTNGRAVAEKLAARTAAGGDEGSGTSKAAGEGGGKAGAATRGRKARKAAS